MNPGSGRSSGAGHGNPLLGKSHGWGTWWATVHGWGYKESNMTDQLSTHTAPYTTGFIGVLLKEISEEMRRGKYVQGNYLTLW